MFLNTNCNIFKSNMSTACFEFNTELSNILFGFQFQLTLFSSITIDAQSYIHQVILMFKKTIRYLQPLAKRSLLKEAEMQSTRSVSSVGLQIASIAGLWCSSLLAWTSQWTNCPDACDVRPHDADVTSL